MGYSPRWYGPNANPIPEAREAMIPQGLRLHNSLQYQLSNKDKTATLFTDLEIPIVSERASVRVYGYGRGVLPLVAGEPQPKRQGKRLGEGVRRRRYIRADPTAPIERGCWVEA